MQLHVIFKSHLDIGFTDLAASVVEDYLHFFIPRAISISRRLREFGRPERFVWTTGSWLIREYLDTRSPAECANLERAILDGDIAWHALPFTMHSELADAALFEAGLAISQGLDARFGKETVAAKVTDVPGHTRGIVPLLARAGVRFLHVGVNGGSSAPEVPRLFKWRDAATQTQIIVLQHPEYGGAHLEKDLGIHIECIGENDPSPSVQALVPFFGRLADKYPQATISGSTLDAFARDLLALDLDLPVVTSEIGDSWIRGAASDPAKLARFRELTRLHRKWMAMPGGEALGPFATKLLLAAEHTWGVDTIMYMADESSYAPEAFLPALAAGRFAKFEASWLEQRNYLEEAIATLDAEKANEAQTLLARKNAWPGPGPNGFQKLGSGERLTTAHFSLEVDPVSGSINHLASGGHVWADSTHPLFAFAYQLYSAADFTRYLDDYVVSGLRDAWWIPAAFARRDLAQLEPVGGLWTAELKEVLHGRNAEGDCIEVGLAAPDGVPRGYGFPEAPFLRLFLPYAGRTIHAEFGWRAKLPCRHPEAIWLQINPCVSDETAWRIDKLGSAISPFDVVRKAGRHLHAVGETVSCRGERDQVVVRPTDAALVSFGRRGILCADDHVTAATDGLQFNLYNNTWGTNFPLWFSGACAFRFTLEFSQAPSLKNPWRPLEQPAPIGIGV